MKIAVFGAGAWGTALAAAAAAGGRHAVLLWARDPVQAEAIARTRRNQRYLGEVALPAALAVTADPKLALAHAHEGLAVVATPMSGLRACLGLLPQGQPVLWLCKGFEQETGLLGHEVAQAVGRDDPAGALSGPSFALEVARAQPTAVVAASRSVRLTALAVEAFHTESLRVYTSDDLVGVEVGGAVKNVLAIACGIADGLPSTGLNARAALVTRGLAEMTRFGVALGARTETFMGLSGLGDLVLTATGDLSRNRRVGLELARGGRLAPVLAALGHVAEGVHTAPMVLARARALGVEMPITEAVVEVLAERLAPEAAMHRLMARDAKPERPGG